MAKPIKKRAALYARVSTRDQRTGMQLEDLRRLAKARGWGVVGEYVDQGISGAKTSRPALDRLMRDAHQGAFDLVAVWRFDRFGRSTRHLVDSLGTFQKLGVDFVSHQEAVDTSTPAGELIYAVFAAVAQFERQLIGERVQAGVDKAKRDGKRLGRPEQMIGPRKLARARKLRAAGTGWRSIARETGIPKTSLMRALNGAG